jgi:hypothetical protein
MHALTLVGVVIEEGVSGSVPVEDRPVGGQLFATLHRGDIVIAAKLGRLFRSALDALKVVESLKTRGVKLHLLDLGGDGGGAFEATAAGRFTPRNHHAPPASRMSSAAIPAARSGSRERFFGDTTIARSADIAGFACAVTPTSSE